MYNTYVGLSVWGVCRRLFFFRGNISPLPSALSYDLIQFFFHVSCFSHFYSNALWFVLQSSVISFFFVIWSACARGSRIEWMDFAAPLYFARPPLAAFAFRLAPIGQTKILRDQAVSVVNSPQVSIYFDYLFIYFSEYFYCAFFFFSFLSVFVLLLYSSCTCASTVCRCSKGHCSM